MKTKLSILAVALMASACGAVSNGGADGEPTPTPTPGQGVTVSDIQKGNVAENTTVTLEGLVVFAVKVGGAGVDFWAQDVGGGAQSGIYFFDQGGNTPADIAVGDEVTVTGLYKEFYDLSEIVVDSVEITNNGLTPDVDLVPLSDLGDPASAEVWESCIVEVDGTGLTVSASVNQYGEFPVTDGTDSVMVDDLLYDATEGLSNGAAVSFLSGIVNYAFEEWKLLPRDEFDITAESTPVVPLTIADLQDDSLGNVPAPGTMVTLENVTVVAGWITQPGTTNERHNFFVQSGSGLYSGIMVYDQDKTKPVLAVGDVVNLVDVEFTEFNGMTEVLLRTATTIEPVSTGGTVNVTAVSLADLLANAEGYESVLVSLNDASLTVKNLNPDDGTPADPTNDGSPDYNEYTIGDGTSEVRVNDILFNTRTTKALDQALTTRIGVLEFANGNFKLEPRAAGDMQ